MKMFEPLQPEIAFSHFVQSFSSLPLDVFFQLVTILGNPAFWFVLAAFFYWKGEEKRSFFVASVLLFTTATVGVLKAATGRMRPSPLEFRVIAGDTEVPLSLPSGHAATITGMFGYKFERITESWRYLWIFAVTLVMISRVYLGAHFIGDVIVGALFGFLIGRIVHYVEQKYAKVKFSAKRVLEETGIAAAVAAALIIAIWFRSLSPAAALFGYFAGVCAYKLLGYDSPKLNERHMWLKQAMGFCGLGMIAAFGLIEEVSAEMFFMAGLWVTLIYPVLYDRIIVHAKAADKSFKQIKAQ